MTDKDKLYLPIEINSEYELRDWCEVYSTKARDVIDQVIKAGHGKDVYFLLINLIEDGEIEPSEVHDFIVNNEDVLVAGIF